MPLRSQPGPDKSGYLSQDTIAALTTAVGGAINVVRLSGPRSFAILKTLTAGKHSFEARKLSRVALVRGDGEPLDDAMAVQFPNPDSFTGEDVVEIHTHGGSFLASRVLEEIAALGARQALPGEFSFRAVRNGKTTVSQAQAVSDLIAASNESALTLALEKMSGAQNRLISSIATELRELATLGELGIDFSDQDVDEVSLPRLKTRLSPLVEKVRLLSQSYDRGAKIQEGVRVAFVGRPNAGKSSFFNALLGEDRSIVSEIAGTTRDVIREKISLRSAKSSVTLRLEDTAGLRSTDDHVEKIGVQRSLQSARNADLILWIVDPTQSPTDALQTWSEVSRVRAPSSRAIGVITKADLAPTASLAQLQSDLGAAQVQEWITISAVTGAGLSSAVNAITRTCEDWISRAKGEVLLTRLDHLRAATDAIEHLDRAAMSAELDLFAADLRQALHALSPLIGETVPDDILGQIFSQFCIGK